MRGIRPIPDATGLLTFSVIRPVADGCERIDHKGKTMSRINRAWHEDNPMPKNANPDQRMAWHAGHAANCGCRAMPAGVVRLFVERGLPVPAQLALKDGASRKD